jgi:hypothetical protein
LASKIVQGWLEVAGGFVAAAPVNRHSGRSGSDGGITTGVLGEAVDCYFDETIGAANVIRNYFCTRQNPGRDEATAKINKLPLFPIHTIRAEGGPIVVSK